MECCQNDEHGISGLNVLHTEELLEDIEQPVWSSLSLSESCASQISSWCSDSKSAPNDRKDTETAAHLCSVSQNTETSPQPAIVPSSACLVGENEGEFNQETLSGHSTPIQEEYKTASCLFESLQSLSSSSQTLYASPRSFTNNKSLINPKNMKVYEDKVPFRRGSLSRDRAPSEDFIIFNRSKLHHEFKLSHSLQDVSSIPSNTLRNQAKRVPRNSDYLALLNANNKSRDSGFNHSDSLLSLNSNGRNFGHVQSKVKLYIQSLKEADAERRKQREGMNRWICNVSSKKNSLEDLSPATENLNLSHIVEKLRCEMAEKDQVLCQLQENYDSLLKKYAEAETRIDRLRFGHSIGQIPSCALDINPERGSKKLPLLYYGTQPVAGYNDGTSKNQFSSSKSPSITVLDNHDSDNCRDISESASPTSDVKFSECGDSVSTSACTELSLKQKRGKNAKCGIVVSAPLRPVSRLYSTSVRLDRILSPLPDFELRPTASDICSHEEQICCSQMRNTQTSSEDTGTSMTIADHTSDILHLQCVDLLPKEDPVLKVQRWQQSNGQLMASQRDPRKCIKNEVINLCQSEDEINKSSLDRKASAIENHQKKSCLKLTIPQSQSTSTICEFCEGKCTSCGSTIFFNRMEGQRTARGDKHGNARKMLLNNSQPLVFQHVSSSKHKLRSDQSPLPSEVVWKCGDLDGLEQDHIVPHSPPFDASLQECLQNLQKTVCSYGKTEDWNNFATLLDILQKMSSKMCCHYAVTNCHKLSVQTEPGIEDSSLLQCLNEVDEYANQLWAKNKSCLEKLDSSK